MKPSIIDIANETLEQDKTATRAPWTCNPNGYLHHSDGQLIQSSHHDADTGAVHKVADGQFIAAARTNAPMLASAVIEMVELLHYYGYGNDVVIRVGEKARALLAKLEGK